ncbi:MAG: tetratricopeptide repeat protein, partial [Paludibacteraceae bacterium]|nr:tetratricopeptide repeat protein [Paludibacteraceae bacterium]
MRLKKLYIFALCVALMGVLSGCGEYQALLKSNDPELKYQKAIEYFNNKQYARAQTLLDDISSYYRGTERSEDVLAYLARSYMGQKDYNSAAQYYEAYIRNYPKGRYATEARFQVGHCYFLDSP